MTAVSAVDPRGVDLVRFVPLDDDLAPDLYHDVACTDGIKLDRKPSVSASSSAWVSTGTPGGRNQ